MEIRRTLATHGRLAVRELLLAAGRSGAHGVRVCTFEQLAARLAGGFACPVDPDALLSAVRDALPSTDLGALEDIKSLPGLPQAAAVTLWKAWRAAIDLESRSTTHPRIAALAALERAVLARLPKRMMRPADLVRRASERIAFSSSIFGRIEVHGLTELSPVWRPLLFAVAETIPVVWVAGPRQVPGWLDGTAVEVSTTMPSAPGVAVVSAATPLHEILEAVRWARELLAAGAEPHDIAIAAAAPRDYDEHLLALRADANLDIRFVHGLPALASREGQAAAALADVLVRGLSQGGIRRLAALAGDRSPFAEMPEGWLRLLPESAPLRSMERWRSALANIPPESWPDGKDRSAVLLDALALLDRGPEAAEAVGEAFLSGRARAIWRKALLRFPAESIDAGVESLRVDDSLDAAVSVAWMPAQELAACPRPFVRLLGLTSRGWPRQVSEDRLLSDHIVPTGELDPLPVDAADRRDFETILRTAAKTVVLSRPRRDAEGRLLGRSPLLRGRGDEIRLARTRTPAHAASESDRLLARPDEFATTPLARSAATCWRDWADAEITPHDGLIRPDHPAIANVLNRTQSASSLRKLLRDPLGYVWKYGLGLRSPELDEEPLVLDGRAFGNLLHEVLEDAVRSLEREGSFGAAGAEAIAVAVRASAARVAGTWETREPVPPGVIWKRTLTEAEQLATAALTHPEAPLSSQRSYAEVRFGGGGPDETDGLPWDALKIVEIPETGIRIGGFIDRIDVASAAARVRDYKTGRPPKTPPVLDGGKELQRCLYAFAVRALLGQEFEVDAALLYPRDGLLLKLDSLDATLDDLRLHLRAAMANLRAGRALPGPDAEDDYNDLAFALPANAANAYCRRKHSAAAALFGDASKIWEQP